ncbi:hypothetical protein RFI36_13600 [Acinetobacter gerneri]|uniref:Uncharacterized protein n=1 Tax=Acinetobacter gerneri TaxID=202952 RepID=A0AAW8JLX1_9GAMM|nr:hypothetical protein [Acinetobacter gerneri]MDQ9010674.1 hypothetical protein [Acinetobacter gerneri]MDQ9014894.1 hypothetical protein [Acinetobacter gerneri]MDQ9026044.1 hypothetical protein [Acinetobacter gerneri]MDQ9053346.1 hypothetical protein [Acinetobacter gerneri]MDQ9060965.1 hypothetical protein [Acinetobacter gerneri]
MKDQKRKREMIRSIENLQLPQHLITALDHAQQAKTVVQAISQLQVMTEK